MSEEMNPILSRYAAVTGSNKGIGLEICRQLASIGTIVVLTARDEKKGLEALEKLKETGISEKYIAFHQLDVVDPTSISSLADFVKARFGKLDILVNNAAVLGLSMDWEAMAEAGRGGRMSPSWSDTIWKEVTKFSYEDTKACLETNYYGMKRMVEAFVPLLELSDSPRIVNVSSRAGKLQYIPSEIIKGVLKDETLTEEKLDELIDEYLKDFQQENVEVKGWPQFLGPYIVSKAAMNAYTRILAKKYPAFRTNCVCPGFVKTDINNNTGILSIEEGAECPVKLALLPDDGPSGVFFERHEISPF